METSKQLQDIYDDYYSDNAALMRKRAIAAKQSVKHLVDLLPPRHESVLDVGAGEGSFLAELEQIDYADTTHALEISSSGVKAIQARKISSLAGVRQFDGYKIDAADNTYSVGTAIHVLEHVEHERRFIQEIGRACNLVYIEVPLEHTIRLHKSVRQSGKFGHINFYNEHTFLNLLRTSNMEILAHKVFANSIQYEQHVSGQMNGFIKHSIRSGAVRYRFFQLSLKISSYTCAGQFLGKSKLRVISWQSPDCSGDKN